MRWVDRAANYYALGVVYYDFRVWLRPKLRRAKTTLSKNSDQKFRFRDEMVNVPKRPAPFVLSRSRFYERNVISAPPFCWLDLSALFFDNLQRIYAKFNLNSFLQLDLYMQDCQIHWSHEAWRLKSWDFGCGEESNVTMLFWQNLWWTNDFITAFVGKQRY